LVLDFIRSKRNSTLIVFALGVIILVFIFWGSGPGGAGKNANIVAVVNGVKVTVREYERVYRRQVQYYKDTFKDAFNDEAARKLDLRHRALDIMINRVLAAGAAESRGISVSEDEVRDAIAGMREFQSNGAFDKDLYFRVLKANRIKPKDFEAGVARDLVTSKMREEVLKDASVTDDEVRSAFMKEQRRIDLGYARFDPARFTRGIEVSEDEAVEYLRGNASAFMVPVRIRAFYVFAPYKRFISRMKVSVEEIKTFYENNKQRFDRPAELRASHILISPDESATDPVKANAAARKKAEALLERIKKGEDFAALARKYSMDTGSAKKGGDLGWFPRGMMVSAFEAAAFSLEEGGVSPVVETQFGYHIIKVVDRKEEGVRPLKDVRASIEKMLREQKGREAAERAIKDLEGPLREAATLAELKDAVARLKTARLLKTSVSALVSEDEADSELVGNEVLRDSAFPLREGELSRPVRASDGLYLIKVFKRVDAHVPDYPKISQDVIARLKAEKADAEARDSANALLKTLRQAAGMEKGKGAGGGEGAEAGEKKATAEELRASAREAGAEVGSTGYFSMASAFMPRIGAYVGQSPGLFELGRDLPVYGELFVHKGKYYVLWFEREKAADPAGLEKAAGRLRERLLERKKEDLIDEWLRGLRVKAKIRVYEERL